MNIRKMMTLGILSKKISILPLSFTDDFARSDGEVGNGWVGNTYAIASGKVINTPTLGAELVTDGGLENWSSSTNLTSWTETVIATSSVNQETSTQHGGNSAARFDIDASQHVAMIYQTLSGAPNNGWLHIDYWAKSVGTKTGWVLIDGVDPPYLYPAPGTNWVNYKSTLITKNGNKTVKFLNNNQVSEAIYYDDISIKTITTASLFLTRPVYPTADYLLSAKIVTLTKDTFAGIAFAIDNPNNPQNYILVTLDGGYPNLRLWKVLNGVISQIATGVKYPFVSNDTIKVAKSGENIRIFVNDIPLITTTVTDSSIKNNLYAGIFSTSSDNQIDDWYEKVTQVGGSTNWLNPYFVDIYLTAVGDSITSAATDELGTGGYLGILISYILSEVDNHVAEYPTRLSAGGWTLNQIYASVDTWIATNPTHDPNIIIFHLGANDIAGSTWTTYLADNGVTWKTQCRYVLDAMHTAFPNAKVYMNKTYRNASVSQINTIWGWHEDIMAEPAYSGFVFPGVDTTLIFTGHPELMENGVDGVHPNHAGYVVIASQLKTLLGY